MPWNRPVSCEWFFTVSHSTFRVRMPFYGIHSQAATVCRVSLVRHCTRGWCGHRGSLLPWNEWFCRRSHCHGARLTILRMLSMTAQIWSAGRSTLSRRTRQIQVNCLWRFWRPFFMRRHWVLASIVWFLRSLRTCRRSWHVLSWNRNFCQSSERHDLVSGRRTTVYDARNQRSREERYLRKKHILRRTSCCRLGHVKTTSRDLGANRVERDLGSNRLDLGPYVLIGSCGFLVHWRHDRRIYNRTVDVLLHSRLRNGLMDDGGSRRCLNDDRRSSWIGFHFWAESFQSTADMFELFQELRIECVGRVHASSQLVYRFPLCCDQFQKLPLGAVQFILKQREKLVRSWAYNWRTAQSGNFQHIHKRRPGEGSFKILVLSLSLRKTPSKKKLRIF